MRWNGADPMAHDYPHQSVYTYMGADPVNLVDPDGGQYQTPEPGTGNAPFGAASIPMASILGDAGAPVWTKPFSRGGYYGNQLISFLNALAASVTGNITLSGAQVNAGLGAFNSWQNAGGRGDLYLTFGSQVTGPNGVEAQALNPDGSKVENGISGGKKVSYPYNAFIIDYHEGTYTRTVHYFGPDAIGLLLGTGKSFKENTLVGWPTLLSSESFKFYKLTGNSHEAVVTGLAIYNKGVLIAKWDVTVIIPIKIWEDENLKTIDPKVAAESITAAFNAVAIDATASIFFTSDLRISYLITRQTQALL